jgi:hypothetical protein
MRGTNNKVVVGLALMVLLASASCTSNNLDDPDSADVIMEITTLDAPSVTAQLQSATSGTCSGSGTLCTSNQDCGLNEVCVRTDTCILEVEDWTATVQAAPKNPLATEPFNDIVMIDVTISYVWVNPAITTPPFVVGLGNVVVPAQGSNSIMFPPISSDAINNNAAIEGSTASLTMDFRARTVEGTNIRQTAFRQLVVEICN